jgi:WD40 repeat protein
MSRVCPQKRMKCSAGLPTLQGQSPHAWDSTTDLYQPSLFSGATDGCWRWYDLRSDAAVHTIQVDATRCRSTNMPVSAIRAMPRRQQVLTCSYDGALRIWDVRTMKPVAEFWHPTKQPLLRCAVMHDAVVVGSVDGSIHAWSFS